MPALTPTAQLHANDCLISAALELYGALQDFVAFHDGHIQGPLQLEGIVKEARAALAKAEGNA